MQQYDLFYTRCHISFTIDFLYRLEAIDSIVLNCTTPSKAVKAPSLESYSSCLPAFLEIILPAGPPDLIRFDHHGRSSRLLYVSCSSEPRVYGPLLTPSPDSVLEVAPTATNEDIKRAYKRAALKWHPDRVPSDSPERPKRTKMFQRINDAYYTLSEPTRRRDYDEARRFSGGGGSTTFDDDEADEEIPRAQAGGGASWANMFGFGKKADGQEDAFANDQFRGAFEEMMGDADMADREGDTAVPNKRFWSIIGGISGFALGFIAGDIVGAIPGAAVGSKMGSIRDAKGKSVYAVFQSLDQSQRARVLSELASKILSGAIS